MNRRNLLKSIPILGAGINVGLLEAFSRPKLRISSETDSPFYGGGGIVGDTIVHLNGEEVKGSCFFADEIEGFIELYVRDSKGEVIRENGKHLKERIYGDVKLFFSNTLKKDVLDHFIKQQKKGI